MELHIAGGCGEHGRNCFHVTGERTNFLVDCGLMASEAGGYPRLPPGDIPKIQAVFLTHSHADHTGALPWLYEKGFSGEVVASKQTLKQLPFKPAKAVPLESICPACHDGDYRGLGVSWGRSGHCLGSVWYRFEAEERSALFSGDYTENSPVYTTDPIRGQRADLAVLDCAYGKDETTYDEACEKLTETIKQLLRRYDSIALPVPRYGRGLDLLALFVSRGLDTQYFGDAHFMEQLRAMRLSPMWYRTDGQALLKAAQPYGGHEKGIVFVSDPQLKNAASLRLVADIIEADGIALMTGTVEEGTGSAKLMSEKKMLFCRYPVHLNYPQYEELKRQNVFADVIPYHSAELACGRDRIIF